RASWAFFFDLDGTLATLVERPEFARVPESTKTLLAQLHEGANGAVDIISGRPLTALDELLYPLVLPAAAEHGAIVRDAAGNRSTLGSEAGQVPGLANWLDQQLAEREGILVERKIFGVAVHFRLAPHAATEISELMTRAAGRFPQFELMAGKMVVEAKLPSVDKGRALAYLMRGEPFAGRRPLMV